MIQTYLLATDFFKNKEIYDYYYNRVSKYRRRKIDRYKFNNSKLESLAASVLLDEILKGYGLSEKNMEYGKNSYGKPYFKGYENINFSLSHTQNYALCSFCEGKNINLGADIQIISRDPMHLVKRFYTKDEAEYVFLNDDIASQKEAFYRIWSLKESYIKAVGKGMSIPIESFSVLINNGKTINGCDGKKYFYKEYTLKNYAIAVCSTENNFSDNYRDVTIR